MMKIQFDISINCEEVNALLSEFLFTELDLEKQKRIQYHLLSCESCSLAFFDLIESSLQSGDLPMPPIPPPPDSQIYLADHEISMLRKEFAPGIDNAGDEMEDLLLKIEVPLSRLAAAPRKTETHKIDVTEARDDNFIQRNQNGFIITLWEIQEDGVTVIGVTVEADMRRKFEGCIVIITDGQGRELLQGRISEGEISKELKQQLAEIASPLTIKIKHRTHA